MKFALAAGILTQSLPFVSAKAPGTAQRQKVDYSDLGAFIVGSNNNRATERNHHQDGKYCNPSSDDPDVGILSCGEGLFCNFSKDSPMGGKCESKKTKTTLEMIGATSRFRNGGILKNGREAGLRSEECYPVAYPDIGILSCTDSAQICVAHPASSMGGFCMPRTTSRRLYHFTDNVGLCDPASEDYMYFDCDCSGFDNATGTGIIPCTVFDHYCLGILYPGCDGTCFSQTRNYTFTDSAASSYKSCDVLTGPFAQTICLERSLEADTCTLSIDDKACSSCAIVPIGNYTAFSFNCSNVGGGVGTTPYILDVAPIIYSCYTQTNSTCDICDGNLTNPDAIASAYGYTHECYIFERGLNESLCSVAAPLLAPSCCGAVNEPTPSPSDNEEPNSTPSEPVPSPGPGPEPSIPSAAGSTFSVRKSVGLSIGLAVAWVMSVVIH